jgi:hypothetical protein
MKTGYYEDVAVSSAPTPIGNGFKGIGEVLYYRDPLWFCRGVKQFLPQMPITSNPFIKKVNYLRKVECR